MKNLTILVFFLLLTGCKQKVADSYFTAEKAVATFSRIEEICNKDGGKLWGSNIMGPVMFVDREERKITASQQDHEGLLKLKDGVYTGTYPRENLIITTSVNYGGTLYGLTPLPPEEDNFRIISRAVHSLFHRYQELSGVKPDYFNIVSMDEKEARIWLKLEWKALRKAIGSEGEEQALAIRDALIFRGSNHEMFPKSARLQNRFECYEGLATFTYLYMATESPAEYRNRLFEYLDRIYAFQSYARSYGTIHGALYATLLLDKGFDFSKIKSDTLDLGEIVKNTYKIDLPPVCRDVAGSIALNYNIEEINKEEEQRLNDIRERLISQVSVFTEKPVVYIELVSPSFDFEPEDVQYLDTLGTLYQTIRVSDNWGKLAADKPGCLISNNYKFLMITAKGLKSDKTHVSGEGWQIILNEGWEISSSDNNYYLRKLAY